MNRRPVAAVTIAASFAALVVAAAPAAARGACEGELQANSPSGGAATTITYTNESADEVLWIWLDGHGDRQLYATLEPGGEVNQPTYAGHYWIVANRNEDCLTMIQAAADGTYEIVADDVVGGVVAGAAEPAGFPPEYLGSWVEDPAMCHANGMPEGRWVLRDDRYLLGRSTCAFSEGPTLIEGAYEATAECGKGEPPRSLRFSLKDDALEVEGVGREPVSLSKCP